METSRLVSRSHFVATDLSVHADGVGLTAKRVVSAGAGNLRRGSQASMRCVHPRPSLQHDGTTRTEADHLNCGLCHVFRLWSLWDLRCKSCSRQPPAHSESRWGGSAAGPKAAIGVDPAGDVQDLLVSPSFGDQSMDDLMKGLTSPALVWSVNAREIESPWVIEILSLNNGPHLTAEEIPSIAIITTHDDLPRSGFVRLVDVVRVLVMPLRPILLALLRSTCHPLLAPLKPLSFLLRLEPHQFSLARFRIRVFGTRGLVT